MKKIDIPAVNRRIAQIAKQFGTDSEVYKRATHYIEANVNDKYLKKNKSGEVVGIRQTKEALAETNLYMRPEALNEYVPTINDLFKSEKQALIDEIENRDKLSIGPDLSLAEIKGMTIREAKMGRLSTYLTNRIEAVYADLNKQKAIVSNVYDVRDNKQGLNDAEYTGGRYYEEAMDLVDELQNGKGRDRDWVRRARALVQRYEDACNKQIRDEIANR